MSDTTSFAPERVGGGCFVTTRWTVIHRAGHADTTQAREALAQLCQSYWYPLYAFVRRRGFGPEDAEDLTQAFFARLLEQNYVADADRTRGRFRTFLLTALNHFLADEWDRLKAQKRGGARPVLSLDGASAETQYRLEPLDDRAPEKIYEQRWAMTLLERVFHRLEAEFAAEGKAGTFSALKESLTQPRAAVAYTELAARLDSTEGALRVAVHRLRHRYRVLLRAEIADTVGEEAEVEDELRYLFRALAG